MLIAHEIRHIQLHGLHGLDVSRFLEPQMYTETQENEANTFALYLLAPLPLLSEHKIKEPSTIKELTGLCLKDCGIVFNRLQDYYSDKCVLNSRNRLLKCTTSPFLYIKQCIIIFLICITFILGTVFYFIIENIATENNENYKTSIAAYGDDYSMQSDLAYSNSITEEITTNETYKILKNKAITTYYWTDSGTVFHTHKNCQSLKNSQKIHSGSLSEAQLSKDRLCKFCEDELH